MTYINITSFCKLIRLAFFKVLTRKIYHVTTALGVMTTKVLPEAFRYAAIGRPWKMPRTKVVKMILIKLKLAKF